MYINKYIYIYIYNIMFYKVHRKTTVSESLSGGQLLY